MNILLLVGGLLLILLGANGLTDGAASVAKRFHIPNIVIGLTIVAFGTSAPELTVSVSSALKGSADIAIGNVVPEQNAGSAVSFRSTVCPHCRNPKYTAERNTFVHPLLHSLADLCQRHIPEWRRS